MCHSVCGLLEGLNDDESSKPVNSSSSKLGNQ